MGVQGSPPPVSAADNDNLKRLENEMASIKNMLSSYGLKSKNSLEGLIEEVDIGFGGPDLNDRAEIEGYVTKEKAEIKSI